MGSHLQKSKDGRLDYESLKNSKSVKIRSIKAEESKYEILIPLFYTDRRNPRWLTCMSKKRTFLDMYQFETYINGFLDLEYPNFDLKHGFLSSVEAEIISFCHRRQPFAFSAFYVHPLTFEGGFPSKFDK